MMGVHPFIQDNPDAVFIMRTQVDSKTNATALKDVGLNFGKSVFGLTDDPQYGVPLTHQIAIKPNLTCRYRWHDRYSIEAPWGS